MKTKIYFFFIIISLSSYSYACGSFFLNSQYSQTLLKESSKQIKTAKNKIKQLKKISSINDLYDDEIIFLDKTFHHYLSSLDSKKKIKVIKNILINKQFGIIKTSEKSYNQQMALKLYQTLSRKNKEKTALIVNKYSNKKSVLKKKLEKILSKKKVEIISRAVINKKLCCLKTCSKCPVNFNNFKKEQKIKKKLKSSQNE